VERGALVMTRWEELRNRVDKLLGTDETAVGDSRWIMGYTPPHRIVNGLGVGGSAMARLVKELKGFMDELESTYSQGRKAKLDLSLVEFALSEIYFVAGDYDEARTVSQSQSRNPSPNPSPSPSPSPRPRGEW
jgi:hypothetical protein